MPYFWRLQAIYGLGWNFYVLNYRCIKFHNIKRKSVPNLAFRAKFGILPQLSWYKNAIKPNFGAFARISGARVLRKYPNTGLNLVGIVNPLQR